MFDENGRPVPVGGIAVAPPDPHWPDILILAAAVALLGAFLFLSGCSSAPKAPPALQAAPTAPVIAKVAIPVPCEVKSVPMPAYPGELIREGDDVYTAARLAMADRRVRIAERDRLRAANANPCDYQEVKQ